MAEITFIHSSDPLPEAGRCLRDGFEAIQARQGFVRLAIPGGSSLATFGLLRSGMEDALWKRTRLTWVDERRVPWEDPDSNRGEAYRKGLLSRMAPPGIELPLYLEGESPEAACRRVEEGLERDFGGALDLVLMGLGEDGHIASLFPGHPWAAAPARVQAVEDSPKPPASRLSLTLSCLDSASCILLVAVGSGKREALARLLQRDPSLPASRLSRLTVVTDQAL